MKKLKLFIFVLSMGEDLFAINIIQWDFGLILVTLY